MFIGNGHVGDDFFAIDVAKDADMGNVVMAISYCCSL